MGPSHLRGGGLRAQSLQLRGELLHAGARGRQLRPGRARAPPPPARPCDTIARPALTGPGIWHLRFLRRWYIKRRSEQQPVRR